MFKKEDEEKNNPFKDENFTEETAEEKPENNEETPVEAPETAKEETPGGKEAALQAELDSLNNKYLSLT